MVDGPTYSPNEVVLFFGDDDHVFRLPLKQIAELEEKCGGWDHGGALGAIYKRVFMGEYRIADCVETIRLGLIGGGMEPLKARRMIERYCENEPKQVLWQHTMAILAACCVGYPPAVEEAATDKKKETATDGSISEPPMATPQSSAAPIH